MCKRGCGQWANVGVANISMCVWPDTDRHIYSLVSAPLCTPPIPPVTNTGMPARRAATMVPETVVPPLKPLTTKHIMFVVAHICTIMDVISNVYYSHAYLCYKHENVSFIVCVEMPSFLHLIFSVLSTPVFTFSVIHLLFFSPLFVIYPIHRLHHYRTMACFVLNYYF